MPQYPINFPGPPASVVNNADKIPIQQGGVHKVATAAQVRGSGGVNVTSQTGTTYTLALGDAGGYSQLNNASAITVTIPTNASVAFPVGTVIALEQTGAGAMTVAAAGGVTLNYYSPSSAGSCVSAGKSAVIQLVKTGTNAWTASGGIA